MSIPEQLPNELVWTAEGHLSDIAMTAIADGEEAILPRDAFGHLGACDACARGVEGAASLSMAVSHALGHEAEPVRRAFPVLAVAAAVALAVLASLPSLGAARIWVVQFYEVVRQMMPLVVRSVTVLAKSASSFIPLLSLASAMLLLFAGYSVARLAPRMVVR